MEIKLTVTISAPAIVVDLEVVASLSPITAYQSTMKTLKRAGRSSRTARQYKYPTPKS